MVFAKFDLHGIWAISRRVETGQRCQTNNIKETLTSPSFVDSEIIVLAPITF